MVDPHLYFYGFEPNSIFVTPNTHRGMITKSEISNLKFKMPIEKFSLPIFIREFITRQGI